MLGTRREIARLHSDFYRDKHRSMLRKLLMSVCISVLLICIIIYLVLFREPPRYYATTTDGQIIPLAVIKSG